MPRPKLLISITVNESRFFAEGSREEVEAKLAKWMEKNPESVKLIARAMRAEKVA
jgi:hypothetical protein